MVVVVLWSPVVCWQLCQLASDFSEDAVRSEGGLKDETTPLTVKR